ncbi:ribokinase [Glycomyces terrestris]|uniref:Ribokinase n=1 Tax=Glycomyces terrestris TaxID=2493553 RepID=A0A426UW06_9ACTN|nr:ribokinase [Glycomyces terrestris]RRR98525.1 ribokinase [Glycomyces terrestris]
MRVLVIGSANLDLVYEVERLPAPGETVLAAGSASYAGGKGNNQAVAAVRAGADTRFIAALGRDDAGDRLAAEARAAGITLLDRRVDASTGTAAILVDRRGENSIVVDSGANARLTDLSAAEREAVAAADVLVLQLETPLDTVAEAVRVARAAGTRVVLNAAPAAPVPPPVLRGADVLIVNEHEAAALAGPGADPMTALTAHGCAVVITLGAGGALVGSPGEDPVPVLSYTVDAVDTTGAGDTFVGAFAAALSGDGVEALVAATGFATAAAAISVQRKGAVPSIPTLEEVREFRDAR